MKYTMEEGQISIFKNERKGKDSDPDYQLKALIKGVEYVGNLWKRQPKSGGPPYLGGSMRVKGDNSAKKEADFNDDLVGF